MYYFVARALRMLGFKKAANRLAFRRADHIQCYYSPLPEPVMPPTMQVPQVPSPVFRHHGR